jgi:diacylglycerol O-acyltransferase / wax synthase
MGFMPGSGAVGLCPASAGTAIVGQEEAVPMSSVQSSSQSIQRASSNDLMELVAESGSAPMQVAAVLVLARALRLDGVRAALSERIPSVPRLRQRLVPTPLGCGRPVWIDDATFRMEHHVHERECPGPGDESALLELAAATVLNRLPRDRPLWTVTLVTGLRGGGSALVLVMHHVLADGIGGLAALARLVDQAPAAEPAPFPQPPPTRVELFADALSCRLRALRALPHTIRLVRDAAAELRLGETRRAPRCSLNAPTGPRRRLAVARADLTALARTAHAHDGTVNDVLLTAVAGALTATLRHRGESVNSFVVSVPVAGRRQTTAAQLGNQVGVLPVEVPAGGESLNRLSSIVAITRVHRDRDASGASAALLAPVFRSLARLGLFQWFVDHQRLVTTFVTNLPGPRTPLLFLGVPVTDIVPIAIVTGNVTVSFAALSYAGTLNVTLIADPDHCPDLQLVADELGAQLDQLARASSVLARGG